MGLSPQHPLLRRIVTKQFGPAEKLSGSAAQAREILEHVAETAQT
jgi:hypothetical protein